MQPCTILGESNNIGDKMTDKQKTIDDALIAFKKLDIAIFKQSTNPFFKKPDGSGSKYADLSTILEAVEVPLADLGLTIQHHSTLLEGQWIEVTELRLAGVDDKRTSTFPLFGTKPQEIGSSKTYARRYNIQSLLNLAAEDDDGNAANNAKPLAAKPVKTFWKTAKEKTELFNAIMAELNATANLDDLAATWVSRTEHLNALKASDAEIFNSLEARKNEIKKAFRNMENK